MPALLESRRVTECENDEDAGRGIEWRCSGEDLSLITASIAVSEEKNRATVPLPLDEGIRKGLGRRGF